MKKLIKMGIGFGVGSIALNKIGSGANPGVMNNVNSAMAIGSMAMPIYSAKKVMKETKKLKW